MNNSDAIKYWLDRDQEQLAAAYWIEMNIDEQNKFIEENKYTPYTERMQAYNDKVKYFTNVVI